jgi:excisionase family DNA binding protein
MSTTTSFASPFLTAAEVADYLRLSMRQVRRLIACGDIPVTRFGRSVRIHRADLEAFVRGPRKLF